MPQGKYPTVGGATREFYRDVLRDTVAILDDAGKDHLVIGGLATRGMLGMPLNEAEDVDVLIRCEDADLLLARFSDEGYATYRRDEEWIYKAARPDVTVDLIFRAGQTIRLDDAHLAHSTTADLEGISLKVPAPEDLVVMKAVFDSDDRRGRWYGALSILRRCEIDWEYLAQRGAEHAPRRVLSLLLYATDAGIPVPGHVVEGLIPSVTTHAGQRDPVAPIAS
jgi:Nucleotidyl transferase of unknown function (DUF2204)